MILFGKRQVKPVAELEALRAELLKVQSAVRTLELEQQAMHDQVRRWMRRAVAAERNQEQARETDPAAVTPASPPVRMTGVRARRLQRLLRADPAHELTNGAAEG